MRVTIQVEAGDFVSGEETEPLRLAVKAVVESHIGHLVQGEVVVQVKAPRG